MVAVTAKSRTITNGTANDGSVVEAEMVELYNNDQTLATAVTTLESGTTTISGTKTFSSPIKTDTISENSSGVGVTIDSVLCKDGFIRVPAGAGFTPTTNGDFGYDSTSHTYDVCIDGNVKSLAPMDGLSHPGFKSGRYYTSYFCGLVSTSTGAGRGIYGTNTIAVPFLVPAKTTFDRISIYVVTAVAASTVQLGIYNNANGIPTTRLLDAGTVATTSTGLKEITISQTLDIGWYWLALRSSSASVGLACNSTPFYARYLNGVTDISQDLYGAIYDSATMPSTWTYTSTNYIAPNDTSMPHINLRVA